MKRVCSDCDAPISRHSKGGRCRPCATRISMADPAVRERRLSALRVSLASEASREAKRKARLKLEAERANDPVWREIKRQCGVRLRASYDAHPDAHARNMAKRAEAGRKTREKRLGWCPEDHRAAYYVMRKQVGAAEAKRIVLADLASKERARVAILTPLERQIERIRNGARLIEKPVYRSAGHDFSLTGNSMAML